MKNAKDNNANLYCNFSQGPKIFKKFFFQQESHAPPSLKLPMPDTYIINPIVIIGTVCVCVCVGADPDLWKGGSK